MRGFGGEGALLSVSCATLAYGYSPLATAWLPPRGLAESGGGTHTVKSGVENKKLFELEERVLFV